MLVLSVVTILICILLYAPSDLVTTTNDRFQLQVFLPILLAYFLLINNETKTPFIVISILWFYFASYSSLYNLLLTKPFSTNMYVYKKIGQSLNKFSHKNYSLLIGEAGIIPYYSKWKCYDFIGLADKEIARDVLSYEYLDSRSPDLIFLYSSTKDETGISMNLFSQNVIYEYMKTKNNYKQIGSLNNGGWHLLIFLKSSISDYNAIQIEIKDISDFSQTFSTKGYSKENITNWYMLKYVK